MPQNKIAGFILERQVSGNNLCQSWLARHKKSGELRFLKIQQEDSEVGHEVLARTIVESYECQKQIKSSRVLSARARHNLHGRAVIEYPYLQPERWQPLTPDVLFSGFDSILPEIALIIDLVHFSGYVHCDLKLQNFMMDHQKAGSLLTLVDLEFMRPDGTPAEATILGTPEHIAPEIRADEDAVVQSDMYSLGVSLHKAVEDGTGLHDLAAERLSALRRLIDDLTHESPYERPISLLDALLDHGLLTSERHQELNRALLSRLLRSAFLVKRRDLQRGRTKLASLLRDIRLLGISPELVEDSQRAFRSSPAATFGVWRELLTNSEIRRFGQYWVVKPNDEGLLGAYVALNDDVSTPLESPEDALSRTDALSKRRQFEKAYLILKRAHDLFPGGDDSRRVAMLERLQDLAAKLNRARDAVELVKEQMSHGNTGHDFELANKLIRLLYGLGRYDEHLRYVTSMRDEARKRGQREWEMRFEVLRMWRGADDLDHQTRLDRLNRIAEEATESGFPRVAAAALYCMGTHLWSRGDFRGAIEPVVAAVDIAEEHKIPRQTLIMKSFLAKLYSEIGRYQDSQKLVQELLRSERDTATVNTVAQLISVGVTNLTRMGELDSALRRNEEAMSLSSLFSVDNISVRLIARALILIEKGDLKSAQRPLQECLGLAEHLWSSMNIGVAHQNLALVAMMQGRRNDCRRHLEMAEEALSDSDRGPLAELDLIACLDRIYNGGEDCRAELLSVFSDLVDCTSAYYASWAAFHLFLTGNKHRISEMPHIDYLRELVEHSPDATMFRAVAAMLRRTNDESGDVGMSGLKDALQVFDLTQSKFYGLAICEAIGRKYLEGGRETMAGRYFEAALRQARGLGNTHLIERLSAQIEQIEKSSASQQRLVDSVRTISDILSRTGSYRESLESLVSFAVEHTGAERGVLLLRKEQEAAMRAAASVNCDDQSRADIERFSSSIPGAVVRSAESLIVDNARSDDRTARFQSIVTHNILSVICVPILHQNEVLGALYLDHHSVPSLFKEEDLTWIETVANFVGVALITAQSSRKLQTDRQRIVGELEEAGRSTDFLTADPGMRRLLDQLPNIASSSAPVLIVGEPGTGKEILADMIHRQSPRSDKPFLKMNCAAVPEDMAESELFGVARGAATGVTEREGKLSAADEGTLLLDEIGDMPLSLQAKLLRAVEYQSFERLGSNRTVYVDVRFLYATNKNLNELVANDLFRADLLDRIQVIKLKITPLRERRGDIPLLLDHFLNVFAAGRPAPRFSDEAMAALKSYRWPGNVRELKNVVEHCTILYSGAFITPDMLPVELGATAGVSDTKETIEEAEAARIRQALAETNWNKSQAARLLGMHVSSLRRRMEKYDIQS